MEATITQAEQDRDEKSQAKATAWQSRPDASGDLEATASPCDASKQRSAGRKLQTSNLARAEEIVAIEKAVETISDSFEIISDSAVAADADCDLKDTTSTRDAGKKCSTDLTAPGGQKRKL